MRVFKNSGAEEQLKHENIFKTFDKTTKLDKILPLETSFRGSKSPEPKGHTLDYDSLTPKDMRQPTSERDALMLMSIRQKVSLDGLMSSLTSN